MKKEHVYMEYASRTNTNRSRSRCFTSETWNKISLVFFVAVLLLLLGLAGYGVYLLLVNVDGKRTLTVAGPVPHFSGKSF